MEVIEPNRVITFRDEKGRLQIQRVVEKTDVSTLLDVSDKPRNRCLAWMEEEKNGRKRD